MLHARSYQKKGGCAVQVVTIKDVARQAGVSISTVSRVLNERPDVDLATRSKVLQVVERLHYVRNANAANLKQRHTAFAAIILRGRKNIFLTDLAERILAIGKEKGYRFLIEIIDEKADEFEAVRALSRERKLFGAIFLGSNINRHESDVAQLEIPCVFATVELGFMAGKNLSSVSVDNFMAGKLAMEQLLQKGHRHVALLGYFAQNADSTGKRLYGAVEALKERRLPYDEGLYEECDFTLEAGYRAMQRILRRRPRLTAVFAISDTIAIGALKALSDAGLRVPEDVSLIGFDGTEQAKYTVPTLSTVVQPVADLAVGAVDCLESMRAGKVGTHLLLPATLRHGASIAEVNT